MKILLINNRHYRGGGADMVYFNTADLLAEAGHEVLYFSQCDKDNLPCAQEQFFVRHGSVLSQVRNYFYNRGATQQLEQLIIAEKPDIAHVHLFFGGLSPSIFSVLKKHHIPLVHTAHDYRLVCPAYLLKDGKGRFCERCKSGKYYNCAIQKCSKGKAVESLLMSLEMYYRNWKWNIMDEISGFIFVSRFSMHKHIEFRKEFEEAHSFVLYNCPGSLVEKSLDLTQDTFDSYYLFYGRLSEEKGIKTLLKAFRNYPHLRLRIVGTGPLEDEIKLFCKKNDMHNIEFLGYKTGRELYSLVAAAKYVCVPSECYENNPMTIVEAYSLATPVIGAAIGGISEIVEDGATGFSFRSGQEASLITALERASTINKDDYTEIKFKAYSFAKENFSRAKHLEHLVNFYESIILSNKQYQ